MSQEDTDQNVYSSLLPVKKLPRDDIENKITLLYTSWGERYVKGTRWVEAKPEDFE